MEPREEARKGHIRVFEWYVPGDFRQPIIQFMSMGVCVSAYRHTTPHFMSTTLTHSLTLFLPYYLFCNIFTTGTGSKFEGTWENDRINGEGISYYPNGNRYEGEWQNGRINGRGK